MQRGGREEWGSGYGIFSSSSASSSSEEISSKSSFSFYKKSSRQRRPHQHPPPSPRRKPQRALRSASKQARILSFFLPLRSQKFRWGSGQTCFAPSSTSNLCSREWKRLNLLILSWSSLRTSFSSPAAASSSRESCVGRRGQFRILCFTNRASVRWYSSPCVWRTFRLLGLSGVCWAAGWFDGVNDMGLLALWWC